MVPMLSIVDCFSNLCRFFPFGFSRWPLCPTISDLRWNSVVTKLNFWLHFNLLSEVGEQYFNCVFVVFVLDGTASDLALRRSSIDRRFHYGDSRIHCPSVAELYTHVPTILPFSISCSNLLHSVEVNHFVCFRSSYSL